MRKRVRKGEIDRERERGNRETEYGAAKVSKKSRSAMLSSDTGSWDSLGTLMIPDS